MTDEIQMPGWVRAFLFYSRKPCKTPLGWFEDSHDTADRDGWTLVFSTRGIPPLRVKPPTNSPERDAEAELLLHMQAATGRRGCRAKLALALLDYAKSTP